MKRRFLRQKKLVYLAIAFSTFEFIITLRSFNHHVVFPKQSWVLVCVLLYTAILGVWLVVKTVSRIERLLFAFFSTANILWAIIVLIMPPMMIIRIIRSILILMWLSMAASGVAILFEKGGREKDLIC
jgi:hypothetical protein